MKSITLITFSLISLFVFSQDDIFPMKGSYIYYSFKEETSNTKHCLGHYFSYVDESGNTNPSAMELNSAVLKKGTNLNENRLSLSGLNNRNTSVTFTVPFTNTFSCTDDKKAPVGLNLKLPSGVRLLEKNILFSLLTSKNLKITAQWITATVKIEFESTNKYNLIFTNFTVHYQGTQGPLNMKLATEELDLEDIYNTLNSKGKQNGKMYDKSMETMREVDRLVNACAEIFSKELKRTYEVDEL